MQAVKKKRTYPTLAQKARMISILDNDKMLQRGKFSSSFTKREAERRWRSLADNLNAIPGARKGWMEWRKTWQDMKAAAKKKRNAARQANSGLEGPTASSMSQEDLNVLETMATMLVTNTESLESVVEFDETEKEMEKILINLVRQQKCLWHPDDPNYCNRRLKEALWLAIARELPTLTGSSMSSDAAQRKWKSLKDARAASIRKLRERSGQHNVPCKPYKYAELMSFLDDIDDFTEQYIELVLEDEVPQGDPLEHMYEQASNSSAVEPEDTKHTPPPLSPEPPKSPAGDCAIPLRYRQRTLEEEQRDIIRRGLQRCQDSASDSHLDCQNDSDSAEVILQEVRRKPDDHHTQFCLSLAPIMRSLPLDRVVEVRIKILQYISQAMHGNLIE